MEGHLTPAQDAKLVLQKSEEESSAALRLTSEGWRARPALGLIPPRDLHRQASGLCLGDPLSAVSSSSASNSGDIPRSARCLGGVQVVRTRHMWSPLWPRGSAPSRRDRTVCRAGTGRRPPRQDVGSQSVALSLIKASRTAGHGRPSVDPPAGPGPAGRAARRNQGHRVEPGPVGGLCGGSRQLLKGGQAGDRPLPCQGQRQLHTGPKQQGSFSDNPGLGSSGRRSFSSCCSESLPWNSCRRPSSVLGADAPKDSLPHTLLCPAAASELCPRGFGPELSTGWKFDEVKTIINSVCVVIDFY